MSTLEKECEKESYQSCANVGFYYDIGKGVPVNPALAAAFYKRGCDGNNAQACTGLGILYKNGRGVEGDKSRAKVLLTKGCNQGKNEICLVLGDWLQDGEFGEKDESQAAIVFQKACDAGDPTGCTQLAWEYLNAKGVPKDEKRGIELLNQGCKGDNSRLRRLGRCRLFSREPFIPKNVKKAIPFFKEPVKVATIYPAFILHDTMKEGREWEKIYLNPWSSWKRPVKQVMQMAVSELRICLWVEIICPKISIKGPIFIGRPVNPKVQLVGSVKVVPNLVRFTKVVTVYLQTWRRHGLFM